jgi:DNA phosphorothioation-dependent restriction protein DptG
MKTVSIEDEFRDLLVKAVAIEPFNATEIAHALSLGFDQAMISFRRRGVNWDDAKQDRLVEINERLDQWSERDTWEPKDDEPSEH